MNKAAMSAAILVFSSSAAMADASLAITLDLEDAVVTTIAYECGSGAPVQVRYVTSGNDSLALVPVDGNDRVFVNVVAASGARYVAGRHEWWTKGEAATLSDLIAGEATKECEAADG